MPAIGATLDIERDRLDATVPSASVGADLADVFALSELCSATGA